MGRPRPLIHLSTDELERMANRLEAMKENPIAPILAQLLDSLRYERIEKQEVIDRMVEDALERLKDK